MTGWDISHTGPHLCFNISSNLLADKLQAIEKAHKHAQKKPKHRSFSIWELCLIFFYFLSQAFSPFLLPHFISFSLFPSIISPLLSLQEQTCSKLFFCITSFEPYAILRKSSAIIHVAEEGPWNPRSYSWEAAEPGFQTALLTQSHQPLSQAAFFVFMMKMNWFYVWSRKAMVIPMQLILISAMLEKKNLRNSYFIKGPDRW